MIAIEDEEEDYVEQLVREYRRQEEKTEKGEMSKLWQLESEERKNKKREISWQLWKWQSEKLSQDAHKFLTNMMREQRE